MALSALLEFSYRLQILHILVVDLMKIGLVFVRLLTRF